MSAEDGGEHDSGTWQTAAGRDAGDTAASERSSEHERLGRRLAWCPPSATLHEGHLSLIRYSVRACDVTIATIFVNPTQFGPQEDFSRYPRTWESDLALLAKERVDLLFAPDHDEIYPPGYSTYVEPPAVADPLEGRCRPGHFRGVATIVLKLFQLAPSDVAYFGQKDFQQTRVIQDMVRDFNIPVRIEVCPIVREADGLAMSSRNRYFEQSRARTIPEPSPCPSPSSQHGEAGRSRWSSDQGRNGKDIASGRRHSDRLRGIG